MSHRTSSTHSAIITPLHSSPPRETPPPSLRPSEANTTIAMRRTVTSATPKLAAQLAAKGQSRPFVTNMAYNMAKGMMPKISDTERTALACGTVGFDKDVSGRSARSGSGGGPGGGAGRGARRASARHRRTPRARGAAAGRRGTFPPNIRTKFSPCPMHHAPLDQGPGSGPPLPPPYPPPRLRSSRPPDLRGQPEPREPRREVPGRGAGPAFGRREVLPRQ